MSTQTSHQAANSSASSAASSRRETSLSSKHSSRSPARQASGHELGFLNVLTEIGRQQLAVATESTSAMCRGSEALRKVQQETAHEASVRHAQAAEKLFSPCQPADMVALQTELMRTNMQSATHYWQELATVAMQTHREMMLSMSHLVSSDSGSGIKSALDAFQAVIPPMASSFFHTPSESSEPH